MTSERYYYKQKDSITDGKNLGHTFYMASDHFNGKGDLVKKYTSFKDYDEYQAYKITIPKPERTFHETILEDAPCWEFYDIDDWKGNIEPKTLYNLFIDARTHFGEVYQLPSFIGKFIVLDSSKLSPDGALIKGSLHILSKNVSFKNIQDQKTFFQLFSNFIKKHAEYEPLLSLDRGKVHGLDKNVYTKNRCFRMEGCTKMGQSRYLTRPSWYRSAQHHEFLITVDVDETLFWDNNVVEPPKPKKINKSALIAHEASEIVQWFDYFNLSRFTDYQDWQTFCWVCVKLGIPEDTIHYYSGLAVNYDYDSTQKIIEAFDEAKCKATIGTFKHWLRTDLEEVHNLDLYYKLTGQALPKQELGDTGPYTMREGFEGINYSNLLACFNTLFIRANMGAGKSLALKRLFFETSNNGDLKYKNIVFVSSKRSLAFDFAKKNPEFTNYLDIKGQTFCVDKYHRLIVQVDSIHKLRGQVDLLILDEMVDLSDQVYNSCNSGKAIGALKCYIKHTEKMMVMDANLARVEPIRAFKKRQNSLFIHDIKKYHTQKKAYTHDDYRVLVTMVHETKEPFYFCSDSKKYLDKIHASYIEEHPDVSVIKITSETDLETKKEDFSKYTGVFVSPSITAGVSYVDERKHVYGLYMGRTISAESASQQLLRFRNWQTAHLCFMANKVNYQVPLTDEEIEEHINYMLKTNASDLLNSGITINPICASFKKDFNYYIFAEFLKRRFISQKFFKQRYEEILSEHGIQTEKAEYTDIGCREAISTHLHEIKEFLNEDFYAKLHTAESGSDNFFGMKKYELYQAYSIVGNPSIPWLKEYYPRMKAYINLQTYIRELTEEPQINAMDDIPISGTLVNKAQSKQKRQLVHLLFRTLGFKDVLDTTLVASNKTLEVLDLLQGNEKAILSILDRSEYPDFEKPGVLFFFINDLIFDAFGFRLKKQRKQKRGVQSTFLSNPIHILFNEKNFSPLK